MTRGAAERAQRGQEHFRIFFSRTFGETSFAKILSLLPFVASLSPPKFTFAWQFDFIPESSDGLPQYLYRRIGLPRAFPQTAEACQLSPGFGSRKVQTQMNSREQWVIMSGASQLPSRRGQTQVSAITSRPERHSGPSLRPAHPRRPLTFVIFLCCPHSALWVPFSFSRFANISVLGIH